jgi:hypothetical protein
MILYFEEVLAQLQARNEATENAAEKEQFTAAIGSIQDNLGKLRPVIDAHEQEYRDLQSRDSEMEQLIHEFKNSLLIEKIKMDTWENKKSSGKQT